MRLGREQTSLSTAAIRVPSGLTEMLLIALFGSFIYENEMNELNL
jgi:hypothetical protein